MDKTENKSQSLFLIVLCWLVYSISYFGKVNYSANITEIVDFYNITKAQAGAPPTFFFFTYGIGQVINGIFCKKYNMKWVIFTSLILSGAINLAVALTTNFSIIKWLWMVNGFALSMLWPTLIRLHSESLPQKVLGKASLVMGSTVATGTLIIYGLSSLYAAFDSFRLSFYTAAFAEIFIAIVWIFLYNKSVTIAKNEREAESISTETVKVVQQQEEKGDERKLILVSLGVLCLCAIGVNLIKDGLTTWVPSILKEEFSMNDSISILLTLFLPVVALFGSAFALKVHQKIPDYVCHCTVIFVVIALFIGGIIGSLSFGSVVLMLGGLIVVSFLASSLNNLVTSIFPLYMRGKLNSGLCAGVLNGFCYLGSTMSSYGLGVIADNFGWTSVFYTLMGFCGLVVIVWLGYTVVKKVNNREK